MIIHPQNISDAPIFSKIVSLVPSQTELLYYLGLDAEVKAITKFCVHPKAWHKSKIHIGGTKNINITTIKKIAPDLIIANREENVKEQVEELALKYDVWVTDVNNLNDAVQMINDIGKLTQRSEAASALSSKIIYEFEQLKIAASVKRKTRAAYFIWEKPYMVAGRNTFINDMLKYCGYENVFSNEDRYPEIKLQQIEERNCELILLSSEPFPFKQKHKEELNKIFPGIKTILVDGEMFSWYGSRLLNAAEYFKKINSVE